MVDIAIFGRQCASRGVRIMFLIHLTLKVNKSNLKIITVPKSAGKTMIHQDKNEPLNVNLPQPNPFPLVSIAEPAKFICKQTAIILS